MTRPLSVLSVCRGFPTPVDPSSGIFVLNRVEAMARQADVRVIQPVPYFPAVAPLPDWARRPGRRQREVEIQHAPMFYLPRVLKRLDALWLDRAIRDLAAAAHRARPFDLVDAHFGYPEGAGCARVARRLGIPLFITIRGFENEYAGMPDVGPPMLAAMRNAAGIVAVSHSLRDLAVAHGVDPVRIRVVHNAVNSRVFRFVELREARARLGLPADSPLLVSVGHLISRKRHHVLIEAFAAARRQRPAARLAIIGAASFEPEYPGRLREQVRRLGLDGSVDFLGNLEPKVVADWLAAADAFTLATAREGCCNAVLESLAMGTPVVTTPVGDNAHFVKESVNGFLVPVDDSGMLAAALGRVLSAHALAPRAEIAATLHRQVGDWDDVAGRVLAFFRERLAAMAAGAVESAR